MPLGYALNWKKKIKPGDPGWYLGGHMDHLAGNTGNLCQGGKGRFVGREDSPMDSSSGDEC